MLVGNLRPILPLTSEGGRLVDREISIPDHREVQLSVTILVTFIGVLGERDHTTPQKVPCHSYLRLPGQSVSWAQARERRCTGRESGAQVGGAGSRPGREWGERRGTGPHRGVLALHAAAVEAHSGHTLLPPLDPDHALVVLLA